MSPSTPSGSGACSSARRRGERHERSLATRQVVVAAAAERFAEVGYHGATLSEIVALSGVTKGAMYFHFPNKEAVADAVIIATEEVWTALLADLDERGADPLHAVVALTEQVVDRVRHDPIVRGGVRLLNDAAVTIRHGATHYQFAEQSVTTRLQDASAAGALRDGVDVAVLGRQIATLMAGHNLICERSDTLDELPARGLTWMADAGVPVHVLRKIAGHGSLTTTQRYLHPDSAAISAAGESLTAFLRAPRSPNGPQRGTA